MNKTLLEGRLNNKWITTTESYKAFLKTEVKTM